MPIRKKKAVPGKNKGSDESRVFRWFLAFITLIVAFTVAWHKRFTILRMAQRAGVYQRQIRFIRTGIPQGNYLHGLDVSRYQGLLEWDRMVAIDLSGDTVRFEFVFIKATEGILLTDPFFSRNWEESRQAGFIRGAYHYFKPQRSAKLQALHFIGTVDLEPGDLPPVIDVEETGGLGRKALISSIKEFSDILEAHYGVKPIIYSGRNFIENLLDEHFKEHHFWIAHYHNRGKHKQVSGIKNTFWQYTNDGRLLGCRTQVDFNVFHGEIEGLKAMCISQNPKKAKISSR